MQSSELINILQIKTQQIIARVENLKNRDFTTLQWRDNNESWNILECLEHLNLYGDFYLPKIERKIAKSKEKSYVEFKSGFLGKYFAESMIKEDDKKFKTFKNKNPINKILDRSTLDRFINQQYKLLELLKLSRDINLNKIKIDTSLSIFIKLKLGDIFQFLVNHQLRHLNQIDRILIHYKANTH